MNICDKISQRKNGVLTKTTKLYIHNRNFYIHNRNMYAKRYKSELISIKMQYLSYLCLMDMFQIYISAITILSPIVCAAVCIVLTWISRLDCLMPNEQRLKTMFILYLSVVACAWFTAFCYLLFPKTFVWLNTLCLASYILPPILFYRIVYYLTGLEWQDRFFFLHYLVPGALVLALFVWSLFVPFDVQVELVESKRLVLFGEYAVYSRFFTSKPLLRMFFMIVYSFLVGVLFVRYYRRVNKPYSFVYKPAGWVRFLIVLMLALIVTTASAFFVPRETALSHVLILAATAFCIVGQHILLTYHIIRREYLLYAMPVETHDESVKTGSRKREKYFEGKLTKQRLEQWFRNNKPYLNSRFTISDVVEELNVNRSRVSSFINRHYGMNFSRYVNHWRLKELEHLMTLSSNREKGVRTLYAEAGFRSIRHYREVVATERNKTRRKRKKPENDSHEPETEIETERIES